MNRNLPRVAIIPSPVLKNHYKKCTYLTRSHDCRCGDDVRRWVSLLCAAAAVKLVVKYVIIYAIYYDYYYLSFFVFFFQIIVVETRTVEHWYHTSPGPGILYIFRTSPTSSRMSFERRSLPPPPPPLDISRTRFPELDTRHRRRNPPPLETGRRRPGTRMPRSACERFSRCRRIFSPKMWVNARAMAVVAPVKIYTLNRYIMHTRIHFTWIHATAGLIGP